MSIHSKDPQHVAIIMDGNGRWAKKHGLLRTQGHLEGVKRVFEIVEAAADSNVKVLTLFAFSTENWSRPKMEIEGIMNALCMVLDKKLETLMKNNLRLTMIGRKTGIPEKVSQKLQSVVERTKNNTRLIINLAFNYGGRAEIVDAVKQISSMVKNGDLSVDNISDDVITQNLYTKDLPDPDLLIRTSGEQRISNFLLWQLSYSEFYFTDVLWPDFTKNEFKQALQVYANRERRFGKS